MTAANVPVGLIAGIVEWWVKGVNKKDEIDVPARLNTAKEKQAGLGG